MIKDMKKLESPFVRNEYHPHAVNCYVPEHRLVMEKHLGRFLKPSEIVHHLDGDRKHNNIKNLHLFEEVKKHIKYHAFMRRSVKEALMLEN